MDKIQRKKRRKRSIRKKMFGTSERPRMCVHKSNRNIYVQIINDMEGRTLCGVSTASPALKGRQKANTRGSINFASGVGEQIARIAVEKGIKEVVFDRSGYRYHGVVKAVAEAARKHGLQF